MILTVERPTQVAGAARKFAGGRWYMVEPTIRARSRRCLRPERLHVEDCRAGSRLVPILKQFASGRSPGQTAARFCIVESPTRSGNVYTGSNRRMTKVRK
jgi:hypothetical protein